MRGGIAVASAVLKTDDVREVIAERCFVSDWVCLDVLGSTVLLGSIAVLLKYVLGSTVVWT